MQDSASPLRQDIKKNSLVLLGSVSHDSSRVNKSSVLLVFHRVETMGIFDTKFAESR